MLSDILDENWYEGVLYGKTGAFPVNFVRVSKVYSVLGVLKCLVFYCGNQLFTLEVFCILCCLGIILRSFRTRLFNLLQMSATARFMTQMVGNIYVQS